MKSWKTPTPEQVSRAVALLGHVERYRYFFDQLENPLWLEPLAEKGFFKRPQVPLKDESKGTVGFPPWPESRYLARMATLNEAQEAVLSIALEIPDTENVRIHEDLTDVALALPAAMAAQLVPRAKKWLNTPYHLLLPEKLGALVGHLARGGRIDDALDLAQPLLAVLPDPRPDTEAEKGAELHYPLEPRPRFDVWLYKQILQKHVGDLVDAAGERALVLLCDLLESAIRLSRRAGKEDQPQDYSWIWRPAVEDHQQNQDETIKDVLVSAVRDAVERLARRSGASLPQFVTLLETRRWLIFRRLALHLLRSFPESAMTLVEERLADRAQFDEVGSRHEYALLAATCFGRISINARAGILSWIDQGPDLGSFSERYRENYGAAPPPGETEGYAKMWRRDRLAPLKEALPPEWKTRYEALVDEMGEPEHPDFSSYRSGVWVGPTSPKTADEIRTMTVAEIVVFLGRWTPSGEPFEPSREGLGRELAAVAAADPDRFAKDAKRFIAIDPTYIRELVAGLREAAKQRRPFEWTPVLDLCAWVVRQPREIPGRPRQDPGEDPDWGWTRKAIADLLSVGFEKGVAELAFDLREQAWSVLLPLTADPQPTAEDDVRYGGSSADPATLSINTTRGEAMHAVMRYALWVQRHVEKGQHGQEIVARGLAEIPEVREVLEAHLDPAREPSLAVRAVYGQWFPWLVFLDRTWAAAQKASIFPAAPEEQEFWDAAWETYVTFCAPYNNTLEILRQEYARVVDSISSPSRHSHSLADPKERLAQHLMTFYWRGKLALEEPGGLLERFYAQATDQLRAETIEFVGRSLVNTTGDVPTEIIDRLRTLWERRILVARAARHPSDFTEEMANFGWWFVSGKFEEDWAVRQLEEVLRIAKKAEPDHLLPEKLAELAGRRPFLAVRFAKGLIEADRNGWAILGWESHLKTILATAMASGDEPAREAAVALVNHLGARGFLRFRELLKP